MFIDHKIATLSIFSKLCQRTFSLADIFQIHIYAFIAMPNTRKRQQPSSKFRIWKNFECKIASFQFSKKFEKRLTWLHLEEISPTIFSKALVIKNQYQYMGKDLI